MKLKPFIILILTLFLFTSCQKDLYNFTKEFSIPEVSKEPPVITYLLDKSIEESVIEEANLRKVADYTKLPYGTQSITAFNEKGAVDNSTRVLCVFKTERFTNSSIDSLVSFVAKGGTLFISKATTDKRLAFLIGLNADNKMSRDEESRGYNFIKPMFPGHKNFVYENKADYHLGLAGKYFSDQVNVLVTAVNDKTYPVITTNIIGKGKVVYFNSLKRFTKDYRGLMFANVLLGLEGIPYPVANVSTIFLDDFPSPVYDISKEPIKSELGVSVAKYVTDYWWPDMKIFAIEQDIKYTAYVTFGYNSYTEPPFTFKEWDLNKFSKNDHLQEKSSWLGRDIIKNGHELGFHGYNHVSLTKENWPDLDYMSTALSTAIKKWNTLEFKNNPVSYVPPSNVIDSSGLAKLHEAIPSIKFIQSVYLGDLADGGNREFDPEPYNDSFFGYPRISSGYYFEPKSKFSVESMYLYTGIWTHFVHPDDVYQINDGSNTETTGDYDYRNEHNLPWYSTKTKVGLFDSFKNYVVDFKGNHPMSRFLTAKEASENVLNWRYAYYTHSRVDGDYIVDSDSNNKQTNYWFMYSSAENKEVLERTLAENEYYIKSKPFLNGNLYTIATRKAYLSLPDLEFYGKTSRMSGIYEREIALRAYKDYQVASELLIPLKEKVDEFIADNKPDKASDLIISFIRKNEAPITTTQWEELATYLVWQKKGNKIWPILEDFYGKNRTKSNADLSRKIGAIAGYENDGDKEKWLTRQINWGTNDENVLEDYVANFGTDKNKELSLKVLEKLAEINPSLKNKKNLISHYLNNNTAGLIPILKEIEPCDVNYKDMATTIAWAYADRYHFDDALGWVKCSGQIDKETEMNWVVKSNSFEDYKHSDFPFYMSVLLANDEKKALENLVDKSPCDATLEHLSAIIAQAYANQNFFQEALDWSKCAKNIPINSKLSWLYELKEYEKLESEYSNYTKMNPEDNKAKLFMSELYLYMGKVKESANIVYHLPADVDIAIPKEIINKEVQHLSLKDKKVILDNYEAILFPEVRKKLYTAVRRDEGNSIEINSFVINDKLEPTTLSNVMTYKFFDKQRNIHSIMGTQSIMYEVPSFQQRPGNTEHNLWGMGYGFKNQAEKKYRYFFKARLERDNFNDLFYQFSSGLSFSKNKNFKSFQLDHFPVRSGAGHSLNIYTTEFNNYNEFFLSNKTKQIVALQGNYYSDSEIEGTILARLEHQIYKKGTTILSPLAEIVYSKSTANRRGGYPYWIADQRFYGGAGFSLVKGTEESTLRFNLDATFFTAANEPNFERYTGGISYRIKNFSTIKTGFEVYTIKNFYSNIFQLGLVHEFK